MGVPKITGFMIGLLVVGFMIATFTGLIDAFDSSYNTTTNTTLSKYSILDDAYEDAEDVQGQALELNSSGNFIDVVGDMFRSGWGVIKSTVSSVDTSKKLIESASQEANIGSTAIELKKLIYGIILILIIVGVFVATLVSREKL